MPYGRRDFGTAACRWQSPVVAAANCRCLGRRFRNPSLRGERSDLTIPARASRVPNLIRHCEEHSDVAISMRLNTRRRTAVATATRLPRYARNDTVGALAMTKCVRMSGPDTTTVAAMPSWVMACAGSTVMGRSPETARMHYEPKKGGLLVPPLRCYPQPCCRRTIGVALARNFVVVMEGADHVGFIHRLDFVFTVAEESGQDVFVVLANLRG